MHKKITRILSLAFCLLLILQQSGFAQIAAELNIAGYFGASRNLPITDKFRPMHLRYLSYDALNNNFRLLLDKGDLKDPKTIEVENTSKQLLKYFFIGISLPNSSFWVNLRPDAEDNIIDDKLAQTDIGKIMLESDLQLKKDTAKATSPETPEGKEYWSKLYLKAGELFGSENIDIPTLTRPWIVPDEIIIRETQDSAYVYKATLKVMLEQDYLKNDTVYNFKDERFKQLNEYSSQLIRELIIPKLTKEVNISKRYASLRQVYYSLILAQWFKARNSNKYAQYSRLINRCDLSNLQSNTSYSVTTYFNAYKESFSKGEYNIRDPVYTSSGQTIRSYFSGGIADLMHSPQVTEELTKPMGAAGNTAVLPVASSPVFSKSMRNLLPVIVAMVFSGGTIFGQVDVNKGAATVARDNPIAAFPGLAERNIALLTQPGQGIYAVDKNIRRTAFAALGNTATVSPGLAERIVILLTQPGQGIYDPAEEVREAAFAALGNTATVSLGLAERIVILLTQPGQGIYAADKNVRRITFAALGNTATVSPGLAERIVILLTQPGQGIYDPVKEVREAAIKTFNEVLMRIPDAFPLSKLYRIFRVRVNDIIAQGFSPQNIIVIYKNNEFHSQTNAMGDSNQFSVARGIEAILVRYGRKVNGESVAKALPFILDEWREQGKRIVADKNSRVVASFSEADMFDPQKVRDLFKGLGVNTDDPRAFVSYKGVFDPKALAKVKEGLRSSIRDPNFNLFYFNYHGLKRQVLFTAVQISGRESDDLHNSDALSYKEFAEDLLIRAENNQGKLSDLTIILDACYSADLVVNALNELVPAIKKGQIKDFPLIITSANRGTEGYQIIDNLKGSAVLRLSNFYSLEGNELVWYYQNMAFFLPISWGKLAQLKETLGIIGEISIPVTGEDNGGVRKAPEVPEEMLPLGSPHDFGDPSEKDIRPLNSDLPVLNAKTTSGSGTPSSQDGGIKVVQDAQTAKVGAQGSQDKVIVASSPVDDGSGSQELNFKQITEDAPTIGNLAKQLNSQWDISSGNLVRHKHFTDITYLKKENKVIYDDGGALLVIADMPETAMDRIVIRFYSPIYPAGNFLAIILDKDFKNQEVYNGFVQDILKRLEAFPSSQAELDPIYEEASQRVAFALDSGRGNSFISKVCVYLRLPEIAETDKIRIMGERDKFKEIEDRVNSFIDSTQRMRSVAPRRDLPARLDDCITTGQKRMSASKYDPVNPLMPRYLQSFGAADCVIVTFYYPGSKIGAMIHIDATTNIIESLRSLLYVMGISHDKIEIRLFGGYSMAFLASILQTLDTLGVSSNIREIEMNRPGSTQSIILDLFDGEAYNMLGKPASTGDNIILDLPDVDAYNIRGRLASTDNEQFRALRAQMPIPADLILLGLAHPQNIKNPNTSVSDNNVSEQPNRTQDKDSHRTDGSSSSPLTSQTFRVTGGIDFRNLPIVTESVVNLRVSIMPIPHASLERLDLTQEWSNIERLVSSGISPSTERLKEYLTASYLKGNLDNDLDRIVSCISDILRMGEEKAGEEGYSSTDPILKDILVVLGSGMTGQELKAAFTGVI